jgi:hypothetical protein
MAAIIRRPPRRCLKIPAHRRIGFRLYAPEDNLARRTEGSQLRFLSSGSFDRKEELASNIEWLDIRCGKQGFYA